MNKYSKAQAIKLASFYQSLIGSPVVYKNGYTVKEVTPMEVEGTEYYKVQVYAEHFINGDAFRISLITHIEQSGLSLDETAANI